MKVYIIKRTMKCMVKLYFDAYLNVKKSIAMRLKLTSKHGSIPVKSTI